MARGYTNRYGFGDIISASRAMEETKELAARVAKTSATVLILGESGTGKELFAHAIHELSLRKKKPFVRVNCSAIPDGLFESELFGYERGSFSGANREGKPGKFELAEGGTLFLDEISELPFAMQGKLLRVLQEREIERIGGTRLNTVDVRIIAGSNRPLKPLISEKRFREDLYYRLRVFPIQIPPLHKRKEDILPLVNFFLDQYCREFGKAPMEYDVPLKKWLLAHDWPGNVRELKNMIEAAVLLTDGDILNLSTILPLLEDHEEDQLHLQASLPEQMARMEKKLIQQALKVCEGDRMAAADQLGIHYSSLYRKMKKYGLQDDSH
ncbi:MAG TPA: sigma 54-interacting transcriptional regulator [Bacillales bacterium]|nr:sigma 54-interacting transcriptional regulator [Bacillales bacterium]